jgi:mono/diheme cytochrome c family protein
MRQFRWPNVAVLVSTVGCGAGLLVLSLSPTSAHARTPVQDTVQMAEGRQLFRRHCASCHGAAGHGDGPAASSMRRPPPDITALALANGGTFPADRVRRIIDGREVEAHGNREMPVWGDALKAIPGDRHEEAVRARIRAIVKYLMSMQRHQA